jgi:hypothetical protein
MVVEVVYVAGFINSTLNKMTLLEYCKRTYKPMGLILY